MKVLQVAYVCRPGAGSEPGVGWELLRAAARHHEVVLLTQARDVAAIEAALADEEDLAPVRVIGVPGPGFLLAREGRMGTGHLDYLAWSARAARVARRLAPEADLGHHVTYSSDWLPSLLHLVPGLPVVWGPVGGVAPVPWRLTRYLSRQGLGREVVREVATRTARRLSARPIRARTALVVGANRDVGRHFEGWGLPVEVEPHVAMPPAPTGPPPAREAHRLVFAARLSSWKGPRLALETLARLPEPWRLDVYGTGGEADQLGALAARLGLQARARFHGAVPIEELREALERGTALLFPSMHDSCPLTVAEAVRVGCPVLCLDIAGPPQLIEGTTGSAVPADRHAPDRLAAAATALEPGAPSDRWSAERLPAVVDGWYRRAAATAGIIRSPRTEAEVMMSQPDPHPPSAAGPDRMEWEELRRYWETHTANDGVLQLDADPDALGNVVWPGQPLWLNRHVAGLQEPAYDRLLDRVPGPPGRALDVGCGSGRWVRRLAARGYDVTGIDLQAELVALDRRRMPDQRFEQVALQDFTDPAPYDLVSTVTVLQHNPFEHHPRLAAKIRTLLGDGGHALILENIHDQASHVFARSVDGWQGVFEAEGFEMVAYEPYDFSPALRLVMQARRIGPGARSRHAEGSDRGPGERAPSPASLRLKEVATRSAATIDRPLERLLARRHPRRGSVHCGMLFRCR